LVPAWVASVGRFGLEVSLEASMTHDSPRVKDRHHVTAEEKRAPTSSTGSA
jgi:hypothetical protein